VSRPPTHRDDAPPVRVDPGVLADAVATSVRAVPGVADLHPGTFGEVATYLAGRRVSGVRLGPDGSAEVHVVVRMGVPVLATADLVRAAVAAVVPGPVDVAVQDVVGASSDTGGDAPGAARAGHLPR